MTASIKSQIHAEWLRASTLLAKAKALTDIGLENDATGVVGNCAYDLKVLGRELEAIGAHVFDLNCQVAQANADIEFNPTVSHLRAVIEGAS